MSPTRLTFAIASLLLSTGSASATICGIDAVAFHTADAQEIGLTKVEIANDAAERAQGLMGVEEMENGTGMLFIFPREAKVAFWMKDTLIPLDMVFINEEGDVVKVHPNARPMDLTPIPSDSPVRYVLEINGGQAAALGITPGQTAVTKTVGPGCRVPD